MLLNLTFGRWHLPQYLLPPGFKRRQSLYRIKTTAVRRRLTPFGQLDSLTSQMAGQVLFNFSIFDSTTRVSQLAHPHPSGIWRTSKLKKRSDSNQIFRWRKRILGTHTAAWVLYVFFDLIRTEFRPGPSAVKTVWKSVRKIKVSDEAKVRFWLWEAPWST